ncbi:hypothetical protein JHK85_034300 [Glycine max]|nr:hypothetical protein JHK85_034300 [Glycine max]KAG4985973.1 hypothetical protein JHK86_033664 [Glycine max]
MAAKKHDAGDTKKRKRLNTETHEDPKASKLVASKKHKLDSVAKDNKNKKTTPPTGRERRLHSKELARLWEKMRRHEIAKEDRAKLVTEALQKMKGKIPKIAKTNQIVYSAKGKQIVLFLDYDGTLSPIVADPDKAFMTRKMRATLKGIARHFPTAIVTGRCRDKGNNNNKAVLFQSTSQFLPMIDEVASWRSATFDL